MPVASIDRISMGSDSLDEQDKREKRLRRFQADVRLRSQSPTTVDTRFIISPIFLGLIVSKLMIRSRCSVNKQEEFNPDQNTIVGTCQNLEKSYLRLTSVCIGIC